jgi:hypothetical protein
MTGTMMTISTMASAQSRTGNPTALSSRRRRLWAFAGMAVVLSILTIAMVSADPAAGWTAGAFLAEFEDLPLAPGLTEVPGGMLFDSPTGRIVEATAQGDVREKDVLAFYAQTLPELGWNATGPNSYRRDSELLKIEIIPKTRPLKVRFSVVPQ